MLQPFALLVVLASGTHESALAVAPQVHADALFPSGGELPHNARIALMQADAHVFDVSESGEVEVDAVNGDGPTATVPLIRLDLTGRDVVALHLTCPGCISDKVFSYTVAAADDDAAPQYGDDPVRTTVGVDSNSPRLWGVSICLPPLVVDEPVLHVVHEQGVDVVVAADATRRCLVGLDEQEFPGTQLYVTVPYTGDGKQFCFDADAVDVAGNIGSAPHTCITLESKEQFNPNGCSSVAADAPTVGAALVLLGVMRVRRRRVRTASRAAL